MMSTTKKLYAQAGATAIAAVLALSSTQLAAQEAPAATQPAPTVSTTSPATPDTAPATTTDTTPSPSTDTSAPDTSASSTTTAPATHAKRIVTRTHSTTVKTAATVPVRTATRSVATHTVHATAAPASAPAAPAAAPAPAPESQSAVNPIVDTTARPSTAAAKPAPARPDNTAVELGAGALALLVIGGGAWALSRRRREDEEFVDEAYEPETAVAAEPVETPAVRHEQPAIVAPSAFAWGNQLREEEADDDGSDRRPGESWVERAYRGPSPANPSVSLRTRLKRAAFFDKREREVAAGTSAPVETDAGLPEAMVDEQEREFA